MFVLNSLSSTGILFPTINPIAFRLGPIAIHWYGIAYILGFLLGHTLAKKYLKKLNIPLSLNDFMSTIMLGIIVGGRIGYVLFYDIQYYLSNPLEILAIILQQLIHILKK